MKLTHSNFAVLSALAMVATSYAATVSSTGFYSDTGPGVFSIDVNGDSVSDGTFAMSRVGAEDGDDYVWTISTTGDLDGDGNATDTFSYDVRYSAYQGSTYDSVSGNVTLGTQIDVTAATLGSSFGPGGDTDDGESYTISLENVIYNPSDATVSSTINSQFIGKVVIANNGTNTFYLGTTGATQIFGNQASYTLNTDSFTMSRIGANAGRSRNLDFRFDIDSNITPVPEPTSAALLGLGGLALVARRKRA